MSAVSETRLRGKESSSKGSLEARRGPAVRVATEILVVGNGAAFLVASVIHFGVQIPLGFATLADVSILPAAIAEGVIGLALAAAGAAVLARWTWAWTGTLAAYLLGIVGVLIGLGVSVTDSGDSSRANLLFHLTILPVLVVGLVLLATGSGQTALGRASSPKVSP